MALKYGINMPASNIKGMLEENDKQQSGIRTWRQLFGNASLGFGAQSDAITSDYTVAMHEAYKANLEQRDAITGAGLSQGSTQRYMGMTGQELMNTYEQFVGGYAKDIAAAANNYGSEVGAIDEALTERATNFSNLYSTAYTYLSEELYGSKLSVDDLDSPIMSGSGKDAKATGEYNKKELDYIKEKGMDWMLYEDGSGLMSWNDLSKKLFNDSGELTDRGTDFFNLMFNAMPQEYKTDADENVRGYDQWLSETNPELRDWLMSEDVFNYNFAGTNRGTANVMMGRDSTDMKEDLPQQTLLNAKEGGYDNFVKTMNEKLSGKKVSNLSGNKQLKDYNNQIFSFKDQTYDKWFSDLEAELNDNSFWTGGISDRLRSDYPAVIDRYIGEYKTVAKNEIDTFKTELNSLLGENMARDFWTQYGKEIDRLYKQVSEWQIVTANNGSNWHGWDDEDYKSYFRRKLDNVKQLKNLGLDRALANVYRDLQTYINKTYTQNKKKPSGF